MPQPILVPIHMDALFLAHDQLVVEAKANFARLPYFRNGQDVNADVPFLSEEILAKPFQNENLYLKAGIHLHWALSDAMTKTIEGTSSGNFPVVPNRWLITRFRAGKKEKAWIVESDYLYPAGKGELSGSISYPFPKETPEAPPFRFLGRKMPWAAWKNASLTGQYLDMLTAVGYGEPTFAAFYPNCHSIFGFHDEEIHLDNLANVSYEVAGWYSNPEQDFLNLLKKTLPSTTVFDWQEAVKKVVLWDIEVQIDKQTFLQTDPTAKSLWDSWVTNKWMSVIDDKTAFLVPKSQWKNQPDEATLALMNRLMEPFFDLETLCFSRLSFPDTLPPQIEQAAPQSQDTDITIANTGTEALSAYIAQQLKGDFNPKQIEDQLEAIQLAEKLEHRRLDIGPKFEEARHGKGFNAVDGGTLWTIRAQSDVHSATQADNVAAQQEVTLPEALSHKLHQLNLLQSRYDASQRAIQSLKNQLFSDWNLYLKCAYPPDGKHEAYPDVEEVRYFIEQKTLLALTQKQQYTGSLSWTEDSSKRISNASIIEGNANCLAAQLTRAINQIIEELKVINREGGLLIGLKLGAKTIDGKVIDASGRDNPGQLVGNVPIVNDDKFHQVANFNGKDAALKLPMLQKITAISFWVNIAEQTATGCLIDARSATDAWLSDHGAGRAWTKLCLNAQKMEAINWTTIPKGTWVHVYLEFSQAFEGVISLMSSSKGTEFLKGRLAHIHVYDYKLDDTTIQRDMNQFVRRQYVLQTAAAPRYWQAKDPVVLITGNIVEPSDRYGHDGKLHCISWGGTSIQQLIQTDFQSLSARLTVMKSKYPEGHFAFEQWSHQPWHPLLLEWQVIMAPLANKSNLREGLRVYDRDFVTENYQIEENAVDLSVKEGNFALVNLAYEFSGSSILTPYANLQLKDRLERYLKKQVLIPLYTNQQIVEEKQNYDFTSEEVKSILATYIKDNSENPVSSLIKAYNLISEHNFHSLSQALGGFNDALLMHQLVMQLPVADPLGFADYQAFAEKIRSALNNDIRSAPNPDDDYTPIRSGVLRINQLRLLDTFGRSHSLYAGTLHKPYRMQIPGIDDMVHLRPRLVQPARLNFRWLSAADSDLEMNEHPATSPICGWLLANNLDHSIIVYSQSGDMLCSVNVSDDPNFILRRPPGLNSGQTAFSIEEVENPYLRRTLNYIQTRQRSNPDFVKHFITVIDTSLANINPENYAQHTDVALLMSRPVALVRASLSLELEGLPYINYDWNVFRNDLLRNTRQTEAFTGVAFPIRLGAYKQLNDGLVGYWIEEADTYKDQQFFAPQSDEVSDSNIITHSGNRFTLLQALSDAPKMLSLLLDPRGVVHATSGILPTKAIQIPPDQYAQALRRIEITFLTSPLLSDSQQVQIPLPSEAGYQWSWLAKTQGDWDEISVPGVVRKSAFAVAFPQQADIIWELLNKDNTKWIRHLDASNAQVIAVDEREAKDLGTEWSKQQPGIEAILAQTSLGQASLTADLSGTNVIREGWLKLKKSGD